MKKRRNQLVHEMIRSVWRTRTRFLSILAIVAIGCGFFAGVKASCPDMKQTADQYFEESRLMDLHLVSTFGFNENDMDAIREVEGVRGLMPGYSLDAFLETGGISDTIVKVYSLPENRSEEDENYLNRPRLVEGRFPERSGECMVEVNYHTPEEFQIGNTIRLLPGTEDTDLSETLATDTYTIVGVVESAMYLGYERGHSTIGDGKVVAFLMIPEEDFTLSVYTDVYLTLEGTEGLSAFSDGYTGAVDEMSGKFEAVAAARGEARYDEIYDEAQQKIDDAKAELADGEKTQQEELSKAEAEIASAEEELSANEAAYERSMTRFEDQIAAAEGKLADGENQLAEGETAYEAALQEYEGKKAEYDAALPDAQAQIDGYKSQREELTNEYGEALSQADAARAGIDGVNAILAAYREESVPESELPEEAKAQIRAADGLSVLLPEGSLPEGVTVSGLLTQYVGAGANAKQSLSRQLSKLAAAADEALSPIEEQLAPAKKAIGQLDAGIAAAEESLADAAAQLDAAKAQLDETRQTLDEKDAELDEGWRQLASSKRTGQKRLSEAKVQLDTGKEALTEAKAEYEKAKADSDGELAEARQKIADAERDLQDLKEPTWYVWNRNNNPEYSDYDGNAGKVDAVAAVFPVFFILVAALVCLTTMTRMVEEQRTQIGTLKALGYSKGAILAKYVTYAMLASFIGAVLGLGVGFKLFPWVIINAYKALYNLPAPLTPIHWGFGAACTAVAVVCMGLTALGASMATMREFPAQLMRPKAPKPGKRVFLERVPFIWKRLNFTQKVTVRNLFRYKRRALMTIVGIAGCTALMLTGFGLRYSILSIGEKQYSSIFVYDTLASLKDGTSEKEAEAALNGALQVESITEGQLFYTRSMDVSVGSTVRTVNLMVPSEVETLPDYVDLHERGSGEKLTLTDEGVIVNEKLAKLLGLEAGDTLKLISPDGREIPVTVTGVCENYALHYVYMTPVLYKKCFRAEPVGNELLLNFAEGADESAISSGLMKLSAVQGVVQSSGINSSFAKMLKSLNNIVWVLILSAGALAIVVLYNLANINVNERIRELATIKVLGFYDREVTAYITRENTVSSILGMGLGLIGGIFLERFVVHTAEVDLVMFAPDMTWDCFVFAGLLTLVFAEAVNFFLHFKLKKIDMVESLKSVE